MDGDETQKRCEQRWGLEVMWGVTCLGRRRGGGLVIADIARECPPSFSGKGGEATDCVREE